MTVSPSVSHAQTEGGGWHPYKYEGVFRSQFRQRYATYPVSAEKETIDNSRIKVTYEAQVIVDTVSGARRKDGMICLLGDHKYLSFGVVHYKYSAPENYKLEPEEMEIFPFAVYRDLDAGTIAYESQMPIGYDTYCYDEKQPAFAWELSEESEEIAGYPCQKAETDFRGRHWTVWFTPEIPVDCGLYKFSGLPGLIIKASDAKGEYCFLVSKIEQTDEPIYRIKWKNKKTIKRAAFLKLEKDMHDDPIFMKKGPDGELYVIDKEHGMTGNETLTPGHYVIPYNPIELE